MKRFDEDHVYIIAEAGVNHNGSVDLALALIDAAAKAGADAVKFQTFDAKKLTSLKAPKATYQMNESDPSETQLAMLTKLQLSEASHIILQEHAKVNGIDFLSTAFDRDSLAFLTTLGIPVLKVASGELTNAPLLWQFGKIKRPLIVSTGMATISEVEQALAILSHAFNASSEPKNMDEVWQFWSHTKYRRSLKGLVTLLHCTSQYPAPFEEVNLRGMDTLASAFGLPVGYSDHTSGFFIPIAAVARGAKVIEKHLTLDRTLPGPDHRASLEPEEFSHMVGDIRALQLALGDGSKIPQPSEWDTRKVARQHVIAARDIAIGKAFVRDDLTTARCGGGLIATALWGLIGQVTRRYYKTGDVIEEP